MTHDHAETARTLRDLFIAEYRHRQRLATGRESRYVSSPRWDGGTDAFGRSYRPVWPKIAARCARDGITDLPLFVKCQFDAAAGHDVFPNHLLGARALENYRQAVKRGPEDLADVLEIQVRELRNRLGPAMALTGGQRRRALRLVLSDPCVALSALFRYYVAAREGMAELAEAWRPAAWAQYAPCASTYDAIWGPWPEIGGGA